MKHLSLLILFLLLFGYVQSEEAAPADTPAPVYFCSFEDPVLTGTGNPGSLAPAFLPTESLFSVWRPGEDAPLLPEHPWTAVVLGASSAAAAISLEKLLEFSPTALLLDQVPSTRGLAAIEQMESLCCLAVRASELIGRSLSLELPDRKRFVATIRALTQRKLTSLELPECLFTSSELDLMLNGSKLTALRMFTEGEDRSELWAVTRHTSLSFLDLTCRKAPDSLGTVLALPLTALRLSISNGAYGSSHRWFDRLDKVWALPSTLLNVTLDGSALSHIRLTPIPPDLKKFSANLGIAQTTLLSPLAELELESLTLTDFHAKEDVKELPFRLRARDVNLIPRNLKPVSPADLLDMSRVRSLRVAGYGYSPSQIHGTLSAATALELFSADTISGINWRKIAGTLKQLKSLSVIRCDPPIPSSVLVELTALESLTWDVRPSTSSAFLAVAALPSLRYLHLWKCPSLTDQGLLMISQNDSIRALVLTDAIAVTWAGLLPFSGRQDFRLAACGIGSVDDHRLELPELRPILHPQMDLDSYWLIGKARAEVWLSKAVQRLEQGPSDRYGYWVNWGNLIWEDETADVEVPADAEDNAKDPNEERWAHRDGEGLQVFGHESRPLGPRMVETMGWQLNYLCNGTRDDDGGWKPGDRYIIFCIPVSPEAGDSALIVREGGRWFTTRSIDPLRPFMEDPELSFDALAETLEGCELTPLTSVQASYLQR